MSWIQVSQQTTARNSTGAYFENIDAIKHNMKYLQENLESKHNERDRVEKQFAEYLVRYKDIMSRRRKMTPEEEAEAKVAPAPAESK
ncbi:MAG: hypothetical protein R3E08_04345 [Thiotrichaceae bacterium]